MTASKLAFLFCLLVGTDATAAQCDAASEAIARDSLNSAITTSKKAFAALPGAAGANASYDRAFGAFTAQRRDVVKKTLSQVIASLTIGDIKIRCEADTQADCASGQNPWAWVHPEDHFTIHLCQRFFAGGEDERPGLIVHEMSHFVTNGATDDYCNNEDTCVALAKTDPDKAVKSAASYQTYVYDYR
ncbi:M35 family metallo-endopeptidase [Rhizobium leguminosarum]|uniref:M35 family metallo-endopeptidase n=1 Tax=Rhizobium leguminosarum TaxID=384 RepID=UPI003F9805BB